MRFLHLLAKPSGNSAASYIHLGIDSSKFVLKAENTAVSESALEHIDYVTKPKLTR